MTFQETIEKSGVKGLVRTADIAFELYRENYDPPLADLFEGIA